MKTHATRRAFLRTSVAGLALMATTACTIINGKNTTTIVLNVAKLRAYAQAGLNASATILAIPPVAAALGAPTIAIISAASQTLSKVLEAFEAQVGENITIVYGTDDLKNKADALLAALEDVATALANATAAISGQVDDATRQTITVSLNALATIIAVFQALLSGSVAVGANAGPIAPAGLLATGSMTEAQALRQLGVRQ